MDRNVERSVKFSKAVCREIKMATELLGQKQHVYVMLVQQHPKWGAEKVQLDQRYGTLRLLTALVSPKLNTMIKGRLEINTTFRFSGLSIEYRYLISKNGLKLISTTSTFLKRI